MGSYRPGLTVSSYTLDTALPVSYTALNTTTEIYGVPFFNPAAFADGQHELTITLTGGDWLWLDEIQYYPSPLSLSKKMHTGAIVGGVVGGVALVAIITWLFILNRQQRSEDYQSEHCHISSCSWISIVFPLRNVNWRWLTSPGPRFFCCYPIHHSHWNYAVGMFQYETSASSWWWT